MFTISYVGFLLILLVYLVSCIVSYQIGYAKCTIEDEELIDESIDCHRELRKYTSLLEEELLKEKKRTKRLSRALYDNGILVHVDEED